MVYAFLQSYIEMKHTGVICQFGLLASTKVLQTKYKLFQIPRHLFIQLRLYLSSYGLFNDALSTTDCVGVVA